MRPCLNSDEAAGVWVLVPRTELPPSSSSSCSWVKLSHVGVIVDASVGVRSTQSSFDLLDMKVKSDQAGSGHMTSLWVQGLASMAALLF